MRKRSWSLRPGNFEANRRIKLSTWTSKITIPYLLSITWNLAWLFTVVSTRSLGHLFLQDSKESVHLFMRKSLVDANDCSGKLGITPGEQNCDRYWVFHFTSTSFEVWLLLLKILEMTAKGGTLQHAVQVTLISKCTLYYTFPVQITL